MEEGLCCVWWTRWAVVDARSALATEVLWVQMEAMVSRTMEA